MIIAVLASYTPESIRNVLWSSWWQVQQVGMSEFLQDKDGRGVESEPSASATPMDVDAVGESRGMGCFVCGRPGHATKDCKLNQSKGKGQSKGNTKSTTDRTAPPSSRASVATVARKATSGQTAGSAWQKRKTRKSTPLMERRRLRWCRQWKTRMLDFGQFDFGQFDFGCFCSVSVFVPKNLN